MSVTSQPISVDFQHLAELERALSGASSEIENQLATLRTKLQGLEWDGGDRAAYNEAQGRWDRAVTGLNEALASISVTVRAANDGYERTELENIRQWQS